MPRNGMAASVMLAWLNELEDGLQVYRRLRVLYPRQRAIISSGHAFPEGDTNLVPELSWLPKPYTARALASAVQQALQVKL